MSVAQTTTTKSITLSAGEQFILPPGASLLYTTNSENLTSTCDDQIPVMEFGCATFAWERNAYDLGDAYFSKFIISTLEYTFINSSGFPSNNYNDSGSEGEKVAQAISAIPNSLLTVIGFDQGSSTSRRAVKVRYPKIDEAIPVMRIMNPSPYGNLEMDLRGIVNNDCTVPSGWFIGDNSANGTA